MIRTLVVDDDFRVARIHAAVWTGSRNTNA